MIIWGSRGITSTKGQGDCHCPACGAQSPYKQRSVRRFFTLYFIPLIPLESLGEYVECQNCKGTFNTEILDYDPEQEQREFQAQFHLGVKGVMIRMVLADGDIDDEEVSTVCRLYEQLTGTVLGAAQVHEEAKSIRESHVGTAQFLSSVAGQLNDPGKEIIVKAAYLVAAADGVFMQQERDMLGEIAGALNMTAAHFKGVIDNVSE
jgi:tellurite resistance protein